MDNICFFSFLEKRRVYILVVATVHRFKAGFRRKWLWYSFADCLATKPFLLLTVKIALSFSMFIVDSDSLSFASFHLRRGGYRTNFDLCN